MKTISMTLAVLLTVCALTHAQTPEAVKLVTDDGVNIVADYYKPKAAGSPVAILLHMHRSDRSAWKPLVPVLQRSGFGIMAIDMRGHGDSLFPSEMNLAQRSVDRDPTLYNAMYRDLAAAYACLSKRKELDMSRLVIIGASVGCSVAIDYGRRDRSVDVVVCMTPGENYLGVDSVDHIKKYGDRPILLLATEDERRAAEKLGEVNSTATVEIVGTGRVHGTHMFGEIDGIEKQIVAFVRDNVGPPNAKAAKRAGDSGR